MSSLFEPLKRESTRDRICATIREAIFDGKLKIGQRLREIPLAKDLQVSRAVVREALQQLAHEGMIELNAFKGAQVVDLTPRQLDEMIGLRLILEAEAVRLAKPKLTSEDKKRLRQLAGDLEKAPNDSRLFERLDFELHETIWKLSGNETLLKHLTLLTASMFSLGTIMRRSLVLAADGVTVNFTRGDHTRLVAALCDGTVEEAMEAIREHIAENRLRIKAAVEKLHEVEQGSGKRKRVPVAK